MEYVRAPLPFLFVQLYLHRRADGTVIAGKIVERVRGAALGQAELELDAAPAGPSRAIQKEYVHYAGNGFTGFKDDGVKTGDVAG